MIRVIGMAPGIKESYSSANSTVPRCVLSCPALARESSAQRVSSPRPPPLRPCRREREGGREQSHLHPGEAYAIRSLVAQQLLAEPMAPMRWNGQWLVSTLNFREQVMAGKGMAAARRAEMEPSGRAESDSLAA